MVTKRVRSDWRDMPDALLPKTVKVRKPRAKADTPESVLQGYAESYLEARGVPYLRLSSSLMMSIFKNPAIPINVKKHIKDAISGWPDCLAVIPITPRFNLSMCLELKTSIGKLHGLQKIRSKEMAYIIARTREEITAAVDKMIWLADRLRADLSGANL